MLSSACCLQQEVRQLLRQLLRVLHLPRLHAVSHLDPQGDLHELLQLHHQLRQTATIVACLGYVIVEPLDHGVQGCKVLLSLRQTVNVI